VSQPLRPALMFLIGASLVASGCHLSAMPIVPTRSPKPAPTTDIATRGIASPISSHTHVSAASPTPAAAATPGVPMRAVQGTISIDGGYLLGAAGAIARSEDRAGSLLGPAVTLISDMGGAVISLDDGTVVPIGGAVLSNNGGNIISNNGGSVVSNNGGGIVIGGRTRYGLAATSPVPLGTLVAVKGMAIVAISLLTGKPLGPATLSEEGGAFRVLLPAAELHGVRLLAKVPTALATDALQGDARLSYSLQVTPTTDKQRVLDEDTAAIAHYLQRIAVGKLMFLLSPDQLDNQANFKDPAFAGPVQALVLGLTGEFNAAVKTAKVPSSRLPALARRMTDVASAYVDLDTVPIDRTNTRWKDAYGDLKAAPSLAAVVKRIREAATTKMRADARYFEGKTYFVAANQARVAAGLAPLAIRKPADFFDFLLETYMAGDGAAYDLIDPVLTDVGLTERDDFGLVVKTQLQASAKSVFLSVATTLLTNPEAKQNVLEQIKAAGPG
jgi:hypothetical protein